MLVIVQQLIGYKVRTSMPCMTATASQHTTLSGCLSLATVQVWCLAPLLDPLLTNSTYMQCTGPLADLSHGDFHSCHKTFLKSSPP